MLTGDVVAALAGPLAPGNTRRPAPSAIAANAAIGRVVTAQGNVTAIRNGVAVTLNVGDAGDAVQTGANSGLGVTFNYGTSV